MDGERLHIVVLDDDPDVTVLIEEGLGSICTGCAITVTNSIEDASAALEVGRNDVLLSDYRIGRGVSTEFLETMAVRHPELRRVLMSGSPSAEWQGMLDRGVVGAALAKPFDLNQLWAVLRSDESSEAHHDGEG
jgi:DNA-binding NtrC family response regulator